MKIVAPLLGVFFLSLIGLMFYWLSWDEMSKKQIDEAKTQLAVLQQFWNQQSLVRQGKLTIGFEGIDTAGFPFGMRVRLLKPYLRDARGEAVFTLATSYVDLIPANDEASAYQIEYPNDGYAIIEQSGNKQRYYLSLSARPEISARKTEVSGRMPRAVNEYGMLYPPTLLFSADQGGKVQRYPMKLTATEEPIWRPIFVNLRERLGSLRGLLRRGGMLKGRL